MVTYSCDTCQKTFSQKGHLEDHQNRKRPCKKDNTIEALVEQKVKEALSKMNTETVKIDIVAATSVQLAAIVTMDYSKKTREELIAICKEKGVKGYSGKKKADILAMLIPTHGEQMSLDNQNVVILGGGKDTYSVLSLFSGMGGMDVGFAEQVVVHKNSVPTTYIDTHTSIPDFVNLKRLPFNVVFQNDILPEAKKIAELNTWNHNFHLKDIRDMLKDNYNFPSADVITGGFPCQDFSHSGKRKGFDSNRGTLYQSYVEVVKRIKPLVFVAENVNGLLTMPGEPIKKIIADFSEVGYEVKYQLIKGEEYGIPQTRWRVIIIGVRLDKLHKLQDNWHTITDAKIRCPVGCYFKHLQEPTVTDDPAQQMYSKAARLEKGQGQKEVGLEEFAPTMRAEHHGNIEFRRINGGKNKEPTLPERRLTVREAALIQTFPPSCILTDPIKPSSKAYKPIGNAVPPLLGYIIARKILSILTAIKD